MKDHAEGFLFKKPHEAGRKNGLLEKTHKGDGHIPASKFV